jgi:hypothetical protein
MLARRLLLLAAVLMLLAALAAGIAPRQQATESPQLEPSTLPAGKEVVEEIPAGPGADSRVKVKRGDVLRLDVSGDVLDSVLIERLDIMQAIEPVTPARFELLVDAPAGAYPIRLVDADRRIGVIDISE